MRLETVVVARIVAQEECDDHSGRVQHGRARRGAEQLEKLRKARREAKGEADEIATRGRKVVCESEGGTLAARGWEGGEEA